MNNAKIGIYLIGLTIIQDSASISIGMICRNFRICWLIPLRWNVERRATRNDVMQILSKLSKKPYEPRKLQNTRSVRKRNPYRYRTLLKQATTN